MIRLYELAGANPELRFSPFCWRVRTALAHKGLEYRAVPWSFTEKGLPGGAVRVPVLVDDDEVVTDSTDIVFHLEDKYGNAPSLFGDEVGEAHGRFIVAWADTVLQPALLPVIAPVMPRLLKPEAQAYFRQTREKRIGSTLEQAAKLRPQYLERARGAFAPVRAVLAVQDFIGGSEPSYGDYVVFGALQWARCAGVRDLLAEDDPIHAWLEHMLDLFDGLGREAVAA
jgi:glutathione S-transferase